MVYKPSPEIVNLLQVIESTSEESDRLEAIKQVASQNNAEACRVLIEVYRRLLWRSTKVVMIKEFSTIEHPRAVEFLILLAGDNNDYGLAAHAVHALGETNSVLAGEFLLGLVQEPGHPLRSEAAQALSHMPSFSWQREMQETLDSAREDLPPSFLESLLLCAGRTHFFTALPAVESYLEPHDDQVPRNVFHAALLCCGSIGNEETIEKLDNLNLDEFFFADQLRRSAISQIYMRQKQNVEDIVTTILASDSKKSQEELLALLAGFSWGEIIKTYGILAEEINPNLQIRFRIVLFDPVRLQSDLAFMQVKYESLDYDSCAVLLRMHGVDQPLVLQFLSVTNQRFACEIMKRLRCAEYCEILAKILESEDAEPKTRIQAANGLVSQAMLSPRESRTARDCASTLAKIVFAETDLHVRLRCLRAIGQIGQADKNLFRKLGKLAEESSKVQSSLFPTLAELNNQQTLSVLQKSLRTLIESDAGIDDFSPSLSALARIGRISDPSAIEKVPDRVIQEHPLEILQILAENKIKGYIPFVNSCLQSGAFQKQIWAMAAARYNADATTWKLLLEFLPDKNICLSGRALDTLCVSGDAKVHEEILNFFGEHNENDELAQKVFRSLTPRPDQDYGAVLQLLSEFCRDRPGVLEKDPQIYDLATNLRDNLILRQLNYESGRGTPDPDIEKKKVVTEEVHQLDNEIGNEIERYHLFSENMKSVLRNAQLTMNHPELFDDRVDKSTVIVEYVKAIDIFLQERIGTVMFLTDLDKMLAKMQSRVLLLRTNDDSIPNQDRIKMLQCAQQFAPDTFPNHKLMQISNSICSGKFARDQYKAVDGLRAWALLLLLFARRFDYGNRTVEPIFPVQNPANSVIASLSIKLIDLQDLRNRAAHRGTILATDEVFKIRKESLELLSELVRTL